MRPFLLRLAQQFGLVGQVWNETGCVMVLIWGKEHAINGFIQEIRLQTPPLARIDGMDIGRIDSQSDLSEFSIIPSRVGANALAIAADAAMCSQCLAELNDPANRRFGYAFTACSDCGPRWSTLYGLPYDRDNTAMAVFTPCAACTSEYLNPANRRFHAQNIACADCGPQMSFETSGAQQIVYSPLALTQAAELLCSGGLLLLKGLGGYHLVCDANNQVAVSRVRQVKHRPDKAFAVMMLDLSMLTTYAQYNDQEAALLQSAAAPIVLLQKQQQQALAASIAPGLDRLGCFLPYTPLHSLLMQAVARPLLVTSANFSDEPLCMADDAARQLLPSLADGLLLHDRRIVNRLDDSVVQVVAGRAQMLRRARGYAPQTLPLPADMHDLPPILALGGQLKNTFCLLHANQAWLSPPQGDLDHAASVAAYQQSLQSLQQILGFKAQYLAVDAHPDYFATQLAQKMALPTIIVQHHHAHVAACMAEYARPLQAQPLLAVVLDGLGMGEQGEWWGGEFLFADYTGYQRLAAWQSIPLLGGNLAMRQPWRNAYAYLLTYFDWPTLLAEFGNLALFDFLQRQPLTLLQHMLTQQLQTPLASSCGRWFDAFAAVLGLCTQAISYEGQAAIMLENLARPEFERQYGCGYQYQPQWQDGMLRLSWQGFWLAVLQDAQAGLDHAVIAARIHQGLVQAVTDVVMQLRATHCFDTVVLTGGVMQNGLVLQGLTSALQAQGLTVWSPSMLPCHDGGLSYGQALVAAARISKGFE